MATLEAFRAVLDDEGRPKSSAITSSIHCNTPCAITARFLLRRKSSGSQSGMTHAFRLPPRANSRNASRKQPANVRQPQQGRQLLAGARPTRRSLRPARPVGPFSPPFSGPRRLDRQFLLSNLAHLVHHIEIAVFRRICSISSNI